MGWHFSGISSGDRWEDTQQTWQRLRGGSVRVTTVKMETRRHKRKQKTQQRKDRFLCDACLLGGGASRILWELISHLIVQVASSVTKDIIHFS